MLKTAAMNTKIPAFLFSFFNLCCCVKIVSNQVSLNDVTHVRLNLELSMTMEDIIVDILPHNFTQYYPTSCHIDMKDVYQYLANQNFASCYNGSIYSTYQNNNWKILQCHESNSTLFASIESVMTVHQISKCFVDNNLNPNIYYDDSKTYFSVGVLERYYGFDSLMRINLDLHFDPQPSLSHVIGTNYVISGPAFQPSAPYGYISDMQVFNGNVITSILSEYDVNEIRLVIVSYLSYVHPDGVRDYQGTLYFLDSHQNVTDLDDCIISSSITIRTFEIIQDQNQVALDVRSILLGDMQGSSTLIGSCNPLPKVIFNNGIYRLSSTNMDKCTSIETALSSGSTVNYKLISKIDQIVSRDSLTNIQFTSNAVMNLNVFGFSLDKIGQVRFLITINGIQNDTVITNVTKRHNEDFLPLLMMDWTSDVNGSWIVLDLLFVGDLKESITIVHDVYRIEMQSPSSSISMDIMLFRYYSFSFQNYSNVMQESERTYVMLGFFILGLALILTLYGIVVGIYYFKKSNNIVIRIRK